MSKTDDYAIEIHARALFARFKSKAADEARIHAKKLKKFGDRDGCRVWLLVAKEAKRIQKKKQS